MPVPPCRAHFNRPSEQDITAALWRVISPALYNLPDVGEGGRDGSDVISLTQDDDEDEDEEVNTLGVVTNLTIDHASASAAHSECPVNVRRDRSCPNNSNVSRQIMENLQIRGMFSKGDFRSCISSLLLSASLYQANQSQSKCGQHSRSLHQVPFVSHPAKDWIYSESESGGRHVIERRIPSPLGQFDLQGRILSELSERNSLSGSGLPAFLVQSASRTCDATSNLMLGQENLLVERNCNNNGDCSAILLSTGTDNDQRECSYLRNSARASCTYSGLIAPTIISISPKQCLIAGGELVTVYGSNFLQQRRTFMCPNNAPHSNDNSRNNSSNNNINNDYDNDKRKPVHDKCSSIDGRKKKLKSNFEFESFEEGDGENDDDEKEEEKEEEDVMLSEIDASQEFIRTSMAVEVLVNETPVVSQHVFIISDTEISFIFPAVERGGVQNIVIKLIERDEDYESSFGAPMQCLPTPTPTTAVAVAVSSQLMSSSSSSGPKNIGSSCTLPTNISSFSTATDDGGNSSRPKGGLSIRSDVCGSGSGWLLAKDRRMRDIRLFFAPQKKMTAKQRERDEEKNRGKDISFFIAQDRAGTAHGESTRWAEVSHEIGDDSARNVRSKILTKKRKSLSDDDEISSYSDSDTDAFTERPPHSSTSSRLFSSSSSSIAAKEGREIGRTNYKRQKDGICGPDFYSFQRVGILEEEDCGGEGIDSNNNGTGNGDSMRVINAPKMKQLARSRPPLQIIGNESTPVTVTIASSKSSSSARRVNRNRVIDEDEDEDEDENDQTMHEDIPKKVSSFEQDPLAACLDEEDFQSSMRQSMLQSISLSQSDSLSSSTVLSALNAALLQCLSDCLHILAVHTDSVPFRDPVDPLVAEDYYSTVEEPMDLSTVISSLEEGLYSHVLVSDSTRVNSQETSDDYDDDDDNNILRNKKYDSKERGYGEEESLTGVSVVDVSALLADINLIWSNCRLYNPPSDPIVRQADILQQVWEHSLHCKLEELSLLYPFHQHEVETRTEERTETLTQTQTTDGVDECTFSSQGTEDTVVVGNSDSTTFTTASAPASPALHYVSMRDRSVKIRLGTVTFDVCFTLPQSGSASLPAPSAACVMPAVFSVDLLRMLKEADRRRSSPVGYSLLSSSSYSNSASLHNQSLSVDAWCSPYATSSFLLPLSTHTDLEYNDQDLSTVKFARLHIYPSIPSVLLTRTLCSEEEEDSLSSVIEGNSKPLTPVNLNPKSISMDFKESCRAVEAGCLLALESMWELQHSFSSSDILGTERVPVDCFFTAPFNSLSNPSLGNSTGSGPSSGKGAGSIKSFSSGPGASIHSDSSSSSADIKYFTDEDSCMAYEESVEGSLCSVRQTEMAQHQSDYQWRKMLRNLQQSFLPPPTTLSSAMKNSSRIVRSSFQRHISCLSTAESNIQRPQNQIAVSTSGICSASGAAKITLGEVKVSQECEPLPLRWEEEKEENIDESGQNNDDDEDEDNKEDEDESEDDKEDEDAFMEECRLVEMESSTRSINQNLQNRLIVESCPESTEIGGDKDISMVTDRITEKERGSTWYELGRDLNSSYLRYTLRKKKLEEYVNRELCGEGGSFDNNCSHSLCSQMALDLLPMLGCMARNEALRDDRQAEIQALVAATGEGPRCGISERRVSTRRNSHVVRARFQHLVCATLLSEPALQALLVYGFIAG